MHPVSSGVTHPILSRIMHPVPSEVMHPISSGTRYPMQSGITPVMSSVPLTLLFPNGSSSAPTTPVVTEIIRSISYQITHKDLLYTQSNNSEQKNRSSKHWLKSEPFASLPAMDTSVARNSKHVTSAISTEVCVPTSIAATPCFSSSAPAASNMFQSQLPSKDTSSCKSASQKRLFSLDVTPKRKTERRLARHIRRQQQATTTTADIVNFAGAKFSESPQAKVVPLPPFIWCEEASSSSSCSGDEQFMSSITEVVKMGMARHGEFHETPKCYKCSPSLKMMPLHCVAVLPSS
ncbi:unnamed protein product [Cercopithifilaria johnstoni]|uniref:Uncharacterized protein n=1 Tax=Cercopithifilaria johnstoni TaxID=2874296 RepID=A0A8J2M041_9BILA|nr:unnamed protein product [Cercopithifilaria johnstoni]